MSLLAAVCGVIFKAFFSALLEHIPQIREAWNTPTTTATDGTKPPEEVALEKELEGMPK